jgi:phosphatidylinositol alpha-mannosyltransferase
MAPLVGLAACVSSRAPLVGTFHRAGTDRLYAVEGRLLRRLAERVRVRVAVSDEARATAEEMLGLDVPHIVPNGVAVPAEPPAPKTDLPTVLFLGRHEERKGLAVLLEASTMVGPGVRFLVANEGPQTESLRRRYGHDRRIEWLGLVEEAKKPALFSSAHLYCSPALGGESFGVVLLEAMAVGTAVVASDLPGYRRAAGPPPVQDASQPVVFVPPGDPVALASAIEGLLGDKDRLAAVAASGRRRAAELSVRKVADAYVQLYRSASRP